MNCHTYREMQHLKGDRSGAEARTMQGDDTLVGREPPGRWTV